MIYLVTGAAGFIASKVCEQLLAAGHRVVGLDNVNDYYDVRLKEHRLGLLRQGRDEASFLFRSVDIEDLAALERVFAEHRFDGVFNLAGRAGVRASIENPHVYLSTNTLGTLNVLECMRRHGVKKHVLASSSSLYAGCPMPFTEDQPVNTPLSPYAATKKAAELLAYSYHKLHGIDSTVLRYFTVFGPAGRPDMSPFRFTRWIDEGRPLQLFGDGTQSRDFTFVDDIARGTVLAARPLGFEVVNLGGGNNPVSLLTVIGWLEEFLGKKARLDVRPAHAADVHATWADIAKAERLLGWKPQVALRDGFLRTVEWHVAHRAWIAELRD